MLQLIENIRLSGHSLNVKDSKLMFTAAPGTSSDAKTEVLTRLRACKGPLIAYLEDCAKHPRDVSMADLVRNLNFNHSKECSGCYFVGEGVQLHPPVSGYHHKEQWR